MSSVPRGRVGREGTGSRGEGLGWAGTGPPFPCLLMAVPLPRSLLEVSLSSDLHTLNMHCNRVARIEGLGHLPGEPAQPELVLQPDNGGGGSAMLISARFSTNEALCV